MGFRRIAARTLLLLAYPVLFQQVAPAQHVRVQPIPAQSAPETAVRQWIDAFNAGDMNKAATFNSPSGTSIIDEFAPYSWTGPNAFADWGAGFDAYTKASGIADPKLTVGKAIVSNVTEAQAYLVFSALYAYRQKGAAIQEAGHVVVAMRKESGTWKVAAWTWTGTVPRPTGK